MGAYAQEAQLLGAVDFPPLKRTVEEVRSSTEEFLAAFIGDAMVGVVSVWPDQEGVGRVAELGSLDGLTETCTRRLL